MHDAERSHLFVTPPVRVIEALGDLRSDVDAHARSEGHPLFAAAREERREVEPGDVLHRDVISGPTWALDRSQIEDLHDVGVRKSHRELRFVDEKVRETLGLG